MNTLPTHRQASLPAGLSLEQPATSIASLTLTDSLRSVMQHVITQWERREAFASVAKFGIHPIRQILFYGPPGNGKTTACQWIAAKLDAPLYRVRCEQLIGSYVGQTARAFGDVMDWLEQSPPCVVLFDEIETIFPSRGSMDGAGAREITSAMTVFWQRLDRWTRQQLFVFATNMRDRLDPAMLSRIQLQLNFPAPTPEQARDVLAYWTETLHEHGGDVWGPELQRHLSEALEMGEGCAWLSFRDLWHSISQAVAAHITSSTLPSSTLPSSTPPSPPGDGKAGKSKPRRN